MSLHRVNSIEALQVVPHEIRERRGSNGSSRSASRTRKLSFNPLPEAWDPPEAKTDNIRSVSAFDVPQWKRALQISVTVVYCLFAAGIVFGFAAIKPVLIEEGAYRSVCAKDDLDPNGINTCVEVRLNLMFTVAAVATNVVALPVGAILDHFGPRVCGLIGSVFLAAGAVLMAFAGDIEAIDAFLVGYLLLALGGPFTFISSFQLSNAFPKHSGLILALLTGAFDSSSALFLVYRIIYQKTDGAFGYHKFFLGYLVVPAFIVLVQVSFMPKQSYKSVGDLVEQVEEAEDQQYQEDEEGEDDGMDDQVDENTALLREERRTQRRAVVEDTENLLGDQHADRKTREQERKNDISGVWGVMHNYTAWEQIRSPWWILICLFTVIQMTRINYFVATIRAQYEALFDDHAKAVAVNEFFDVALPVGGILSIPFIGLFLDNMSTVSVLTVLVATATAIGVLGTVPVEWAAYLGICLFVIYRPFYYTAVSDYSAKVFGFKTFGTTYGLIICLAGLLGFTQSGLDFLFHDTFNGDPVPVNVILLSAGFAVGICLVGFVGLRARGLRRKMLEMEAENAVIEQEGLSRQ